jgi:hypothetical protein
VIVIKNTKYGLRVAQAQAADRPAGGWPPEGRIIMTLSGLLSIQRLLIHGIMTKRKNLAIFGRLVISRQILGMNLSQNFHILCLVIISLCLYYLDYEFVYQFYRKLVNYLVIKVFSNALWVAIPGPADRLDVRWTMF